MREKCEVVEERSGNKMERGEVKEAENTRDSLNVKQRHKKKTTSANGRLKSKGLYSHTAEELKPTDRNIKSSYYLK